MKKLFLPLLVISVFASCTEDENSTIKDNEIFTELVKTSNINYDNLELFTEKFNEFNAVNKQKNLKRNMLSSIPDCTNEAIVPDDYSTIQEAVDAVCEYGTVVVKSGVYNETVGVSTEGVFLKAKGDVLVNGAIGMEANNVKIKGFRIDNTTSAFVVGIASIGYGGFEIKNNTIFGNGHIGIYFRYSNENLISNNNVSGPMDWAIFLDGDPYYGGGVCNYNRIINNSISDISPGPYFSGGSTGIVMRGECSYNEIQMNDISDCFGGIYLNSGLPGAGATLKENIISDNIITDLKEETYLGFWLDGKGISLRRNCDNNIFKGNTVSNSLAGIFVWNDNNRFLVGEECDGNVFKKNTVFNCFAGFALLSGGDNNTIGPNNEFNENDYGIAFDGAALPGNHYWFNNTALDNTICDIKNFGASNNNIFKNNTADCIEGID